MYWPSGSWRCKQARSVAALSQLICALILAFLPSVVKDLKTITLCLTII